MDGFGLEKDFMELYEENGEKRVHILFYAWENDGREVRGVSTPITVTEYTFCDFPLKDLLAADDRREFWMEMEANVKQYEGDYTTEEFEASGYDFKADEGTSISLDQLTEDTPCGEYLVII